MVLEHSMQPEDGDPARAEGAANAGKLGQGVLNAARAKHLKGKSDDNPTVQRRKLEGPSLGRVQPKASGRPG
jgi:hypothetical protein